MLLHSQEVGQRDLNRGLLNFTVPVINTEVQS